MSTSKSQTNENQFLAPLAAAIVKQPRGTLAELAKAAGISKASLYRYSRTRDELINRLIDHSTKLLIESIDSAKLDSSPPLEAFKRLNTAHLEHREMIAFVLYFRREKDIAHITKESPPWVLDLDAFFLRGQKEGVFRIDIPAQGLTEIWAALTIGLVDSERRGRIARASLATIMNEAFIHGMAVRE